jgi:hypothetical protein
VVVTIDDEVKTKWRDIINETLNDKISSDDEKFAFVAE